MCHHNSHTVINKVIFARYKVTFIVKSELLKKKVRKPVALKLLNKKTMRN